MRKSLFLLPFTLAILIGCNQSDKKQTAETAVLKIRNGVFDKQGYGTCDSLNTTGACVDINLWLPSGSDLASVEIQQKINQKVIEHITSYSDSTSLASHPEALRSTRGASEVFIQNFNSFKKEMPDAPGNWFIKMKGDTVMVTSKIMTYQLDDAAFTGGAHPNSFRSFHIYDANTGNELEAKTFIADSLALLAKVETAFRKLEKLTQTDDLEAKGYFLPDHQFFLPANYAFTSKGILFYYNPYEIAAYARGPIEIVIPYSELENIVKKDMIY